MNDNLTHKGRIIFELSQVSEEIREIGNQFNLLDIDNMEHASKKLQEIVRYHKKPKSAPFTVTL